MRILHVLRAPVGGLFRHVLDLAAEQAARGHEVGILADSNTEDRLTAGKFAKIAPQMALGIARIPMSRHPGLGDYGAYRAVARHAAPLNLDVLHGHGAKGGAYARLAARRLNSQGQHIRSFYTPHGGTLNFKPSSIEGRVFLKLERMLERYTTGLIFESQYAADVYHARVSNAGAPYRVIPNGLQPADFEPARPNGKAADLLYIGELRAIKGVDVLLDAIAEINKSHKLTATIVGAGPSSDELKAKASAIGLEGLVTFTGALPARDAFDLGHVMVVPSRAESFPYVVLEAAAAGLPLISTSVGGIPEIVSGTDTALIPPDNVPALVAALRDTLERPAAAQHRAQRLKENVSAKFTVSNMADTVLSFYGLTVR